VSLPPYITVRADGAVVLAIKAVPGARRDQIAGPLGDRLKIRVSAPPEGGKANKAISRLLAAALSVRANDVTLEHGPSSPLKTWCVRGVPAARVAERLGNTDGA